MVSRARRYLIASAALAALTLAGCPKKESPEDIEFAAQQAKKAALEKKKKVDVFDEFYVDDAKKAPADSKGKAKGKADAAAAPAAAPAAAKQSAPLAAAGSQSFSKNGRYVVQVSSTASESDANRMAAKLKGLGYPAYVVSVQNPTPALTGTFFRVRLGGFDSYSEAKAFAEGTLLPAGYDYWVDRKANDNVGIQGGGFGSAGGQQQYQAPQPYQPAPAQQPAARPQQPAAAPQQYQPAPAPQPAAKPQQPPPAPQQYQPAAAPQQFQPAQTPQQYQPAPAPAPAQPAAKPQQQPPAPAPAPAPQPAAKPQQPPPPPTPAPAPAPAPAPQPAAKPQQPPPAAPAPAAKQQQPAPQPKQNDWGTTDDWGSDDW